MTSQTSLAQYGTSLAKSFLAQFDYRIEFQNRTFSSYDDAAREISLNWDPQFLPNFEIRKGEPVSRQQNFFTLFSFAESLSELLIGIEQLGAYELLETTDFDQFANFVSYTSSFHLIDSFLCLGGTYFVPNPVEDCEWVQDRKMTIRETRGVPMYRLNPVSLKINQRKRRYLAFPKIIQRKPRYLIGEFREHESGTRWSFRCEYGGSIHVSRWRCFGETLKALIRVEDASSIPRPVQQFFGLFEGPIAYLGLIRENEKIPLNKLIDYACIGSRSDGITTEAFAPKARNLAIYRNQSLDEYLRRLGPTLDPSIIDSPSKIYGAHFHRLASGIAAWQVDRLSSVLSQLEKELPEEIIANGMRSALLFSGLVELDFSKVVDNPLYNALPAALRKVVAPLFRDRRYIPGRIEAPGWQVGTEPVNIHFLRLPITIPEILTPRPDWLPNVSKYSIPLK
ncbi:MAG: hypothetical protein ACLPY5_15580 [Candidatus Bathyarchaeia archaeon]